MRDSLVGDAPPESYESLIKYIPEREFTFVLILMEILNITVMDILLDMIILIQ